MYHEDGSTWYLSLTKLFSIGGTKHVTSDGSQNKMYIIHLLLRKIRVLIGLESSSRKLILFGVKVTHLACHQIPSLSEFWL